MSVTLSNPAYDNVKRVTQVGLPALGSLYFGLSAIWDLPAGEEVVGSIALLTTFLGVVLGVSTKAYNNSNADVNGEIVIERIEGKKVFALQLDGDPDELDKQQRVVFKVVDKDKEFWDRPFDPVPRNKHPL